MDIQAVFRGALCKAYSKVFVFVVLAGVIFLVLDRTLFAIYFLSVVSFYFLRNVMYRLRCIWPSVFRRFVRQLWRLVCVWRRFYKVSQEVEFLFLVGWLLAIIAVFVVAVTRLEDAAWMWWSVGSVMMLAAAIDLKKRVFWLLRKAWARALGKTFFAGMGAMIIYMTTAIAKSLVQNYTHVNADNYPEFVGLMVSILTPVMFIVLAFLFTYTWALIEFILWSFIPVLIMPFQMIMQEPFFDKDTYQRLVFRIVTGKRKEIAFDGIGVEWRWMLGGTRIVAVVLFLVFLVKEAGDASGYYEKDVDRALTHALIWMEYRPNSSCSSLRSDERVVYLQGSDYVSVVDSSVSPPVFTIRHCILDAKP